MSGFDSMHSFNCQCEECIEDRRKEQGAEIENGYKGFIDPYRRSDADTPWDADAEVASEIRLVIWETGGRP